ncbi:hypothetical protein M1D97_11965 [Kushneria sp. AK178]
MTSRRQTDDALVNTVPFRAHDRVSGVADLLRAVEIFRERITPSKAPADDVVAFSENSLWHQGVILMTGCRVTSGIILSASSSVIGVEWLKNLSFLC